MTYGTPVSEPGQSRWHMTIRDTSAVSAGATEEGMTIHMGLSSTEDVSPYSADLPLTEDLFQKVITALEAHTDLTVTFASRTYPTAQDVTP